MVHWAHPTPQPKRHLDRFSRFCRARSQLWHTDRQTEHATRSVTIGRIYIAVQCGLIFVNSAVHRPLPSSLLQAASSLHIRAPLSLQSTEWFGWQLAHPLTGTGRQLHGDSKWPPFHFLNNYVKINRFLLILAREILWTFYINSL